MQDGILESEDQENDVSNANSSCPEVKVLNKKRYQLNKIENRVVQMKTIIQKLIFMQPNAGYTDDKVVNDRREKMMFFCGKSLDSMRSEL